MKFYEPEVGDIRYRTFFALFPVKIGKETRWLEKVKVREIYSYNSDLHNYYWDKTRFDSPESNRK